MYALADNYPCLFSYHPYSYNDRWQPVALKVGPLRTLDTPSKFRSHGNYCTTISDVHRNSQDPKPNYGRRILNKKKINFWVNIFEHVFDQKYLIDITRTIRRTIFVELSKN